MSWPIPLPLPDLTRELPGQAVIAYAFALVLGWIALAGLTGWLAGRKGRGSGDWTLLGLVLGPLALLAVLLLSARRRA
jgi:hypothetical protein